MSKKEILDKTIIINIHTLECHTCTKEEVFGHMVHYRMENYIVTSEKNKSMVLKWLKEHNHIEYQLDSMIE